MGIKGIDHWVIVAGDLQRTWGFYQGLGWVRKKGIMPLELAVRRLTFDSATGFGIYDRGLLQPGMAADLVVFDPDPVQPVTGDVVHDFPNNGWRMRELAEGIHYTVVNGEVLLEKGTHTGSYPGRVLHNARYHGSHNRQS